MRYLLCGGALAAMLILASGALIVVSRDPMLIAIAACAVIVGVTAKGGV